MFTLSVNAGRLLRGLSEAPDTVYSSVTAEMGDQMEDVARQARRKHRFITRSGHLERATLADVLNDMTGAVYIDDGIAEYGKYIYKGHGSWKADRFIHAAMRKRRKKIVAGVNRAIDEGLREAGL